jgi:hypothetical protein
VLKSYVNQIGEVDYAAIKTHRKDLDDYVRRLGEASPTNRVDLFPTHPDELAYWINAYNAFVTRGVVDRYPTRSVRDLGLLYSFFLRKDYTAGGAKMSLRSLENDIIRKRYGEPRIHFAIVCASLSCPMLSRDAFAAGNLEELLTRQARRFINQRRNVNVNAPANQVTLSSIFKWYRADFEGKQSLLEFVRRYADVSLRSALDRLKQPKISYYDYDWSINDPGSRARSKNPYERELALPVQ